MPILRDPVASFRRAYNLKVLWLSSMGNTDNGNRKVEKVNNLIINGSMDTFLKEELGLLNKRMNYALKEGTFTIQNIIVTIEAAIQWRPTDEQETAKKVKPKLYKDKGPKSSKETAFVKGLREKPLLTWMQTRKMRSLTRRGTMKQSWTIWITETSMNWGMTPYQSR